MTGWLYLFIIVVGFCVEVFVRGRIIVSGNSAATAHNLAAFDWLWRLGFGGEATMWLFSVVTMTVFYVLFRPVDPTIALMALVFNIMDTAIESVNAVLCNFAALFFSQGLGYFQAFGASQREAVAAFALRLHEYGFGAGLLFFGIWLVLTGYLMVRSGNFPKWIGILAAIGGVCYAGNSYALFVVPDIQDHLFPLILVPSLVAELSISIYMIVFGFDVGNWGKKTANGGEFGPSPS
ncbi:MAG TPA: DUF4386 domain-containing protein [Candidatus Tumulicola sp.]